jgi:hypothetical protein
MNRALLICIFSLCTVGCATHAPPWSFFPKILSSQGLDITPGEGIRDVAVLGMTAQDVARNTGNGIVVELSAERGQFAYAPDLGFYWQIDEAGGGIQYLTILAEPGQIGSFRLNAFRGTLCGSISLARGHRLTRERVYATFGPPSHVLDLNELGTNWTMEIENAYSESLRQGESGEMRTTAHADYLAYPSSGINFALVDDVVTSLTIRRKVEQTKDSHDSR